MAVHEGTTVRRLLIADGAVTGVETDGGEIAARAVVIAAGGWSAGLAAVAGCAVPAVPVRHELFVTAPIAGIAADTPHVRVMDANAYARPYRGGLMFGAYETAPTEVDAGESPGGLPTALASPTAALADRAAAVLDVIPALPARPPSRCAPAYRRCRPTARSSSTPCRVRRAPTWWPATT